MSNKNLLIVLVLVVLGAGAYWWYTQQGGYQTPSPQTTYTPSLGTPEASPKIMEKEKTVKLSEQNNSKEMGTATLKETSGKVVVTLNLTGAPKGVKQPAHIHMGSCATLGAVKYPLTSPTNGWSETTLNVTMKDLTKDGPIAINVHKSVNQSSVYVACGDVK